MTEKVAQNENYHTQILSQALLLGEPKNQTSQILDPFAGFYSEKPDKHILYQKNYSWLFLKLNPAVLAYMPTQPRHITQAWTIRLLIIPHTQQGPSWLCVLLPTFLLPG